MPASMRRSVFSQSGFFRSKMLSPGIVQSMISAALRQGLHPNRSGVLLCVGSGHKIFSPEERRTACTIKRSREVAAP